MTLETLHAGAGQVAVLAGGSVANAAADGQVNVRAGGLLLQVGGALGSATDAIEIQVGTLAALAASGGMFLSARADLGLGTVSVGLNQVGLSAQTVRRDASLNGVASLDGGAVVLLAEGDIRLGQVNAVGASVTLVSSQGAIVGGAAGSVHVVADQLYLQAAGSVGRSGQSIRTDVRLLSASSLQGGVYLAEGNDLLLGNVSASGHVSVSAGGALAMTEAAQAQALSIDFSATGLALGALKAQAEVRLDGRTGEIRSLLTAGQTNVTADSLVMTGLGVATDSPSTALRAQVDRVQLHTGEAEQVGSWSLRDRQTVFVLQSANQVLHQQVVVDGRALQRSDSGAGHVTWAIQPLSAPIAPRVPTAPSTLTYDEAKALLPSERGRRSVDIAELSKPNAMINMMLELEQDSDTLKEAFVLEGSMGDGQASKDLFDFDLWVEELTL